MSSQLYVLNLSFVFVLASLGSRVGRVGAVLESGRENAFIGYSEKSLPGGCKDDSDFCADWASKGECTKNSGYMEVSCAVSCKKCSATGDLNSNLLSTSDRNELQVLTLKTHYGDIKIKLRPDLAPQVVAQVVLKVNQGPCGGSCKFYRAEGVPAVGAVDNFGGPGPPYALLQGSLGAGWKPVAREGAPIASRGMVCLIGNGPDFFISLNTHTEWGHAHTIWGEVQDMEVVDAIVSQPVKEEIWGQTHVTSLVTPVPFRPLLENNSQDNID
mmetsp:Transcript_15164/g.20926  ORF Transcript_15164/g.20926 Transcript_15164/m.20926 type:complete len:271 (-) Transcript_15164:57-869(-)|eukprot:CAMPEP_0196586720 /NCGR_PEP_ID=MMETSP1081-20130531/55336_1 /TAXON_ID=36882 /ORGANISM="Pyramimonas amylifera, Strain CCMP720" /LENGTH=270 /DNA_ID=CAMNT_0041908693 /DNA_START=117 /DNA_END=929 /DNA_ORIENTATION=+